MRQKQSLALSAGFLSGILLCLISSCSNGPAVRVHVSDPESGGMEYYDQRTKQSGFIPYSESDKFVCFNPADTQTLLNYCGVKK